MNSESAARFVEFEVHATFLVSLADGTRRVPATNESNCDGPTNMFWQTEFDSLTQSAAKPAAVRRLTLIQTGESLAEFAELLPKLVRVREIRLGWQSWRSLPHGLGQLAKLRSFTVLNTPLEEFPVELANCRRLTHLVLRGTDIATIPPSVQAFQQLRELDFTSNPVREISPELGKLSSLRRLGLADNHLTSLPPEIANLRRLRSLGLPGNRFSAEEIARIKGWFGRNVVSAWAAR